jgi:catechol 2,3-dioxygenase-like lactoylglutathione lyase family enzyme
MEGVSHQTFLVRDLNRMASFMCDGLGAVEVYDINGENCSISREKFFVLGGVWIAAKEGRLQCGAAIDTWPSAFPKKTFRVIASDLSALGSSFFHFVPGSRVRESPCMSTTLTITSSGYIAAHFRSALLGTPVLANC